MMTYGGQEAFNNNLNEEMVKLNVLKEDLDSADLVSLLIILFSILFFQIVEMRLTICFFRFFSP